MTTGATRFEALSIAALLFIASSLVAKNAAATRPTNNLAVVPVPVVDDDGSWQPGHRVFQVYLTSATVDNVRGTRVLYREGALVEQTVLSARVLDGRADESTELIATLETPPLRTTDGHYVECVTIMATNEETGQTFHIRECFYYKSMKQSLLQISGRQYFDETSPWVEHVDPSGRVVRMLGAGSAPIVGEERTSWAERVE